MIYLLALLMPIDAPLNLRPNLRSGEMRVMRSCDLTVIASRPTYPVSPPHGHSLDHPPGAFPTTIFLKLRHCDD